MISHDGSHNGRRRGLNKHGGVCHLLQAQISLDLFPKSFPRQSCVQPLRKPTANPIRHNHNSHESSEKARQSVCGVSSDCIVKPANQPSVADVLKKKTALLQAKRKALDLKIVKITALNLQPSTIVQDRGFQDLLKEAAPGYLPLSRTMLSHALVLKLYDDTKKMVRLELQNMFEWHGVSFTSDMCPSTATESYISQLFLDDLQSCSFCHDFTSGRPTLASILAGWRSRHHFCLLRCALV
ncbi:hypothetical protein ISCGN_023310 [Ixodes scapularis]